MIALMSLREISNTTTICNIPENSHIQRTPPEYPHSQSLIPNGQVVTIPTSYWEVPGQNFCVKVDYRDRDFHGFTQSNSQITRPPTQLVSVMFRSRDSELK